MGPRFRQPKVPNGRGAIGWVQMITLCFGREAFEEEFAAEMRRNGRSCWKERFVSLSFPLQSTYSAAFRRTRRMTIPLPPSLPFARGRPAILAKLPPTRESYASSLWSEKLDLASFLPFLLLPPPLGWADEPEIPDALI